MLSATTDISTINHVTTIEISHADITNNLSVTYYTHVNKLYLFRN